MTPVTNSKGKVLTRIRTFRGPRPCGRVGTTLARHVPALHRGLPTWNSPDSTKNIWRTKKYEKTRTHSHSTSIAIPRRCLGREESTTRPLLICAPSKPEAGSFLCGMAGQTCHHGDFFH